MTQRKSPGKPISFGSVLAGATAVRRSVRVCFNGQLLGELDALNVELARARLSDQRENTPDEAPGIAKRIVELEDEMRDAEVEFVFESVGAVAWRNLVAAHPPKDDDKKAGRDYNGKTFPVAAMAASCVVPEGASVEGFQEIADSPLVMQSQLDKLFSACLAANAGSADVPFSRRRVADSAAYRNELRVARDYGLPRSLIIGGPIPKRGEPLFAEDDTNGALALLAYEDSLCAGCGHPAEESMARDAEGTFTPHLYICHACAEIERYKNRLGDQSVEPGARISVTKS